MLSFNKFNEIYAKKKDYQKKIVYRLGKPINITQEKLSTDACLKELSCVNYHLSMNWQKSDENLVVSSFGEGSSVTF